MTHDFELQAIQWIQQFRNPIFDHFFKFLDYFDRQEFYFVLIPIVWAMRGWKSGMHLFYILILSSLTNHALKELFLSPRPFHLDAQLGIIQVKGLGFPSGAGQTVILLSGILLTTWKSPWKWAVAFVYIVAVSFSRVYLGIHFPTDILGGWVVGFGLLGIYLYLFPAIEKRLERLKPFFLFVLSQAGPLLLLLGQYTMSAVVLCSVAMGMGVGVFAMHKYSSFLTNPRTNKEVILRSLVGVVGTFGCYAMTFFVPTFLRFLIVGLWVSLGSEWVYRKLFSIDKGIVEVKIE